MKAVILHAACVLLLVGTGCLSAAARPDVVAADDFARAPRFGLASLSPDGTWLAFVRQDGRRQVVVVRALGTGTERTVLELEPPQERVGWCDWAGGSHLLCGTVSPVRMPQGVAERTRLYFADAEGGRTRPLNPRLPTGLQDQVIDLVPSDPRTVLIHYDTTGSGYPQVARLDVLSGDVATLVPAQPPVRRWIANGHGEVMLGVGYESGEGSLFRRARDGETWEAFLRQPLNDPDLPGPLAVDRDGGILYALKHHEGRAALFRLSLADDAPPELMFAHPRFDVPGPLIQDGRSGAVLGVRYIEDRAAVHYFDRQEAERQQRLDRLLPGRVNITLDRTLDGATWLVESYSDRDPPSLYLYAAGTGGLTLLGHQHPELEDKSLAAMRSIVYPARDGQPVPGYLTLPAGPGTIPRPAVILPHGGPESRDHWKFDPLVQFLAARGYAVLQMNFRGSTGYGARFAALGAGQWGGVVHNDITDGARWLIAEGIADPARLCIVGASFGGYAAMLGAARESQWYACAVAFAGISDLLALGSATERRADAALWRERLGSDSVNLWQMSPLSRVRTIETPLLLVHGRLDAVVPVRQSVRLARALRREGKAVRFEQRGDCDHDLSIESCRQFYFGELAGFLAEHLR